MLPQHVLKTRWSIQYQEASTNLVCLCYKAVCNDNSKYAVKICESIANLMTMPNNERQIVHIDRLCT